MLRLSVPSQVWDQRIGNREGSKKKKKKKAGGKNLLWSVRCGQARSGCHHLNSA